MKLSEYLAARHGSLGDLISALASAGVEISRLIRRARISDVIGPLGDLNVQGEIQQKLDVLSDQIVLDRLRRSSSCGVYVSEEQTEALLLRPRADGGEYCVLSDPLDGSSNIDVAAGVGTIFSVLPNVEDGAASALQPGRSQVASGYVLYGSSTLLVLATDRVDMFVLDPDSEEFHLVGESLEIPPEQRVYSINEAYADSFSDGVRSYLRFAHAHQYGARYIGSMVADLHRILIKGGVFLYPGTAAQPGGKLRLMYEANPMARVMEAAGGRAVSGEGPILDLVPERLHERCPVFLGSRDEVALVLSHLAGDSGSA